MQLAPERTVALIIDFVDANDEATTGIEELLEILDCEDRLNSLNENLNSLRLLTDDELLIEGIELGCWVCPSTSLTVGVADVAIIAIEKSASRAIIIFFIFLVELNFIFILVENDCDYDKYDSPSYHHLSS